MVYASLRHVALRVSDVPRARTFYQECLGMKRLWQPDAEQVYLSSGTDILALHALPAGEVPSPSGGLDHLGFIVKGKEDVDEIFRAAETARAPILKPPKTHRDGSYSFYMADPDGNAVQILFEPHVSPLL